MIIFYLIIGFGCKGDLMLENEFFMIRIVIIFSVENMKNKILCLNFISKLFWSYIWFIGNFGFEIIFIL